MDDSEDIVGGKAVDRQPVEDLAPSDAHTVVTPPGDFPGPCGAFVGAHAHSVNETTAKVWVCLEIVAQFALDGTALMLGGTPSLSNPRLYSPLFDPVEQ